MPMHATHEELELKEHVASTLARQGVLGKIKAQLRAAVFHAMHDHEPDEELAFSAKRLEAFKREGELALEIVQDFLAFFQLEHSLAVLRAEASVVAETDKRLADEFEALGLQSQGKSPLVIQLLHQQQQPKTTATSALAREGSMLLDDRQAREWLSSSSSSHHSGREEAPSDKADERAFEVASLEKLSSERLASATGSSRFDIETHNTPQRLSEDRSTAASVATKRGESDNDIKKKLLEKDEDGDDEEEEAKDESIASASELDESIAEEQSASLTYSQDYESASRDDTSDVDDRRHSSAPSGAAAERSSAAPTIQLDKRDDSDRDDKQEHPDDDDGSDKEEDSEPAVLAPPPVPTLLSPLPSLNAPRSRAIDAQHDDDDFDEEREAARLSSLDAKLKAMEAEDETGTLQQLKASLQMELQHDDESVAAKRDAGAVEAAATVAATASRDHDDDHDGYGSDFEEEEVISEVSDDEEIESVADLSVNDDDDSVVLSTLKPLASEPTSSKLSTANKDEDEDEEDHRQPELQDRAVTDESALNSYDYIEDVEKDW